MMGEANSQVRSVLLVTTELRAGGTERCVTELATRLDPKKFKCQVVSLAPFPQERTQFYDQLKKHDIPLASLDAGSAWSFLRARRRLVDQIDQFRPDWVLSFLFHANVLTAYALKRFPGLPHLANIRVADPRNWRLPVERWGLRRARKIICVSEAVKQHCQQVGNYPKEKLCVIPNGVDLAQLDRQMAESAEMDASTLSALRSSVGPHVGFGGRLDPQKGLDQLLRAWPVLLREFPDAQLWIAGEGPQRPELELQTQQLGLEGRLHWLGWQPEPWRALQHCGVLVFPSRWEGMSNALLEGMATGKPVVANEIEGVHEVLGAGPREQLAQPEQPESLVRNLSQVLSNQELASDCGSYNRQRIEQHYSIDGMIQRFTEVMESTV
jgi:glycosyltransferase involved in cell wall biosynthesis